MNTVMHNFLLDVPQATAIWLALTMLAAIAVAGMLAPSGRQRSERAVRAKEIARRRSRLLSEVDELSRYADEVAVAASRAATTVSRRRAQWLAARDEAEAAWRAYDAAEAAARRVAGAGALPTPDTPHTPAEYADRERFMHRAAMAACWRGELTVLELSDALANRNGWDPRRHPVEQEVFLRRAVRDRLAAVHRAATDRERAAWHAAEVASEAARSLRDEAATAVVRARRAQWRCDQCGSRARLTPATRTPRPSARPALRWRTARAG